MGPDLFLPEHLFCLSPIAKPRRALSLDNVGLQNMSYGDLELHGHSDMFFPFV